MSLHAAKTVGLRRRHACGEVDCVYLGAMDVGQVNLFNKSKILTAFFLQWLDPSLGRLMESRMRLVGVIWMPPAQLTRSAVTQAATITPSTRTNAVTTMRSPALTHPGLAATIWCVDLGVPVAMSGVTTQLMLKFLAIHQVSAAL